MKDFHSWVGGMANTIEDGSEIKSESSIPLSELLPPDAALVYSGVQGKTTLTLLEGIAVGDTISSMGLTDDFTYITTSNPLKYTTGKPTITSTVEPTFELYANWQNEEDL